MPTAPQTPATTDTTDQQPAKKRHLGKAVIAGTLAVGLLAAGGGTFSKWYDETQASPGTIGSGALSLSQPTAVKWRDVNSGTSIADPAGFRMIPGDVVEFTTTTTVTAIGDNLTGVLDVDLEPTFPSSLAANDAAVAMAIAENTVIDVAGLQDGEAPYTVQGEAGDGSNAATADNGAPVTVKVTITWPADVPAGTTAGQNMTVNLEALKLTLTQNA